MTDDLGALQTSTGVQGCPARGCTAKLGAGDGRDMHTHISGRFRFTDDFLGEDLSWTGHRCSDGWQCVCQSQRGKESGIYTCGRIVCLACGSPRYLSLTGTMNNGSPCSEWSEHISLPPIGVAPCASPRAPYPTERSEAVRTVFFYKSGDPRFGGLKVAINKTYKTFDSLLDNLSQRIPLPFGVRTISSPQGTHFVQHLDDLHHGQAYVCSDQRRVRPIDLAVASQRPEPWRCRSHHTLDIQRSHHTCSSLLSRAEHLTCDQFVAPSHQSLADSSLPHSSHQKWDSVETCQTSSSQHRVYLLRNRQKSGRSRLMMVKTHPMLKFRDILNKASQVMGFPVLRIYTTTGQQVVDIEGLLQTPALFVAVGRKRFKHGPYENLHACCMPERLDTSKVTTNRSTQQRQFQKLPLTVTNSRKFSSTSSLSNSSYTNQDFQRASYCGSEGFLKPDPVPQKGSGSTMEEAAIRCDDVEKHVQENTDGRVKAEMWVRLRLAQDEIQAASTCTSHKCTTTKHALDPAEMVEFAHENSEHRAGPQWGLKEQQCMASGQIDRPTSNNSSEIPMQKDKSCQGLCCKDSCHEQMGYNICINQAYANTPASVTATSDPDLFSHDNHPVAEKLPKDGNIYINMGLDGDMVSMEDERCLRSYDNGLIRINCQIPKHKSVNSNGLVAASRRTTTIISFPRGVQVKLVDETNTENDQCDTNDVEQQNRQDILKMDAQDEMMRAIALLNDADSIEKPKFCQQSNAKKEQSISSFRSSRDNHETQESCSSEIPSPDARHINDQSDELWKHLVQEETQSSFAECNELLSEACASAPGHQSKDVEGVRYPTFTYRSEDSSENTPTHRTVSSKMSTNSKQSESREKAKFGSENHSRYSNSLTRQIGVKKTSRKEQQSSKEEANPFFRQTPHSLTMHDLDKRSRSAASNHNCESSPRSCAKLPAIKSCEAEGKFPAVSIGSRKDQKVEIPGKHITSGQERSLGVLNLGQVEHKDSAFKRLPKVKYSSYRERTLPHLPALLLRENVNDGGGGFCQKNKINKSVQTNIPRTKSSLMGPYKPTNTLWVLNKGIEGADEGQFKNMQTCTTCKKQRNTGARDVIDTEEVKTSEGDQMARASQIEGSMLRNLLSACSDILSTYGDLEELSNRHKYHLSCVRESRIISNGDECMATVTRPQRECKSGASSDRSRNVCVNAALRIETSSDNNQWDVTKENIKYTLGSLSNTEAVCNPMPYNALSMGENSPHGKNRAYKQEKQVKSDFSPFDADDNGVSEQNQYNTNCPLTQAVKELRSYDCSSNEKCNKSAYEGVKETSRDSTKEQRINNNGIEQHISGRSNTTWPDNEGESDRAQPECERDGDVAQPKGDMERPESDGEGDVARPESEVDGDEAQSECEGEGGDVAWPNHEGDGDVEWSDHQGAGDEALPGHERDGDKSWPEREEEGDVAWPNLEGDGDAAQPDQKSDGKVARPNCKGGYSARPDLEGDYLAQHTCSRKYPMQYTSKKKITVRNRMVQYNMNRHNEGKQTGMVKHPIRSDISYINEVVYRRNGGCDNDKNRDSSTKNTHPSQITNPKKIQSHLLCKNENFIARWPNNPVLVRGNKWACGLQNVKISKRPSGWKESSRRKVPNQSENPLHCNTPSSRINHEPKWSKVHEPRVQDIWENRGCGAAVSHPVQMQQDKARKKIAQGRHSQEPDFFSRVHTTCGNYCPILMVLADQHTTFKDFVSHQSWDALNTSIEQRLGKVEIDCLQQCKDVMAEFQAKWEVESIQVDEMIQNAQTEICKRIQTILADLNMKKASTGGHHISSQSPSFPSPTTIVLHKSIPQRHRQLRPSNMRPNHHIENICSSDDVGKASDTEQTSDHSELRNNAIYPLDKACDLQEFLHPKKKHESANGEFLDKREDVNTKSDNHRGWGKDWEKSSIRPRNTRHGHCSYLCGMQNEAKQNQSQVFKVNSTSNKEETVSRCKAKQSVRTLMEVIENKLIQSESLRRENESVRVNRGENIPNSGEGNEREEKDKINLTGNSKDEQK